MFIDEFMFMVLIMLMLCKQLVCHMEDVYAMCLRRHCCCSFL